MERPTYQISPLILKLVSQIQELLGEIKPLTIRKPPLKLRRASKIKTIHHSLAIEGNSLTESQVTDILESKRVIGPKKQILEVKNALDLYDRLSTFEAKNEKDFLAAHKILMNGLVEKPGTYRRTAVGIFKGTKVTRMAPKENMVPRLMSNLFSYLKRDTGEIELIKACVFHYELEFIHPFVDGNGRMGRTWQQRILMEASPSFEFLSVESLIHKNQNKYYKALEESDLKGSSTPFIEYSLEMILLALLEFTNQVSTNKPKASDRIGFALDYFGEKKFSRRDYIDLHKGLSTATASRDLAQAVKENKLKIFGTKSLAQYKKS